MSRKPANSIVLAAEVPPSQIAILAAPLPPDRNPPLVYLARLRSPASEATMRFALERAAALLFVKATIEYCPWHLLRYQHVESLRARLLGESKTRTVNKILSAVRGVLRVAKKLKLVDGADIDDAIGVKGDTVHDLLKGRALEQSDSDKIVDACKPTNAFLARDGAMIGLLFGGGLRRAEAAGVNVEHIDRSRWEVKVRGKGAKERLVPLPPTAVKLVLAWFAWRGEETGPLLVPFTLQGKMRRGQGGELARMSMTGVFHAFRAVMARAGVKNVTTHDARRTRITAMLSAGESIAQVRDIAGHKSVETTARYDRSGDDAKRAAANRVDM